MAMQMNKTSKMLQFINYRMKVNVDEDNRTLVGTFLAFDKHMNLILSDCQEYRKIKAKRGSQDLEEREEMRSLGLVLLRGESVVSIQVEAPPKKKAKVGGNTGRGVPIGRGEGVIAVAPPTLAVPAGLPVLPPRGMGAPPPLIPGSGRGMPPGNFPR